MATRYYEDGALDDELRYGLRYQDDLEENEKGRPRSSYDPGDSKSASKKSAPHTRGTAISFGFRRRTPATTGIPVPVASSNNKYIQEQHQRSKSVGPEHESRRRQANDEDYYYQPSSRYQNYSSSGRSTPRLAPPKKESSGLPIRTNRFGFRTQPIRFTDKVTDLSYNNHQLGQNRTTQDQFRNVHHAYNQQEQDTGGSFRSRQSRSPQAGLQHPKPRPSPVNHPTYSNNNNNISGNMDPNRRNTEATVGKYTLHSSHLPIPQYARLADSSSKIAKTVANQNRKVGTPGRVMPTGHYSSKEGSGTEDSGIGSHGGCSDENGGSHHDRSRYDYYNRQTTHNSRPRKLGVILNGKSFDVRDIDEDHTVTEISVIQLPQNFAQQQLQHASPNMNLNTGIVRERTSQYQRLLLSKDNRYADSTSTTSMSTTSSEGYDEGLGEEKVFKDRSRSEKLPASSSSSMMRSTDFSVASSADEHEFGHAGGEAMADEYSFSSTEDFNRRAEPMMPCNTITQTTHQHFKAISNAAKNGTLPKSTLRSVLLTIEDPAFAAVAATTTTLIDDETSPVDSLFDSPTASVSQSDIKFPKKETDVMEKSGNTIDDDSPGTPTNASNSLSLSEGREFFDDEIADQPGLVFDETVREGSITNTEHSQTVLESLPKINALKGRSVESSPIHGRKMNRAGSVSTLSSCESLASDDLMMDYERSDASSFGEINNRANSTFVMQDLDDATSLLELEIQGQEAMREWNSLLGQSQTSLNNSTNNNINTGLNNNQNTESGLSNNRTSRLLSSRSSTDSPRSLDGTRKSQVFSPLRPPRNIQSPSLDSGDEGSLRIERGTYSYMFQDIVSIKTMLLKLKRVLQESGENGLTRDSLTPFDNSLKNGLFYNLNDGNSTTDLSIGSDGRETVAEELMELRRQVVSMQSQLDDKDHTIATLQAQLSKYQNGSSGESVVSHNGRTEPIETANATTQTEKLRPVSAGPSVLQGMAHENGAGHYVSWSDSWSVHHHHSPNNHHHHHHQQQHARPELSSSCSSGVSTSSSYRPASSSRRSSSSSNSDQLHHPTASTATTTTPPQRPSSLRGLRLPNGSSSTTAPSSPSGSSIPMPITARSSRLQLQGASPTMIPRAARAVSASGRHRDS